MSDPLTTYWALCVIFLARQTVARILVAATRNKQALDRINRLGYLEDLGLYF